MNLALPPHIDLAALYRDSGIGDVLAELDRDLVGLVPVKTRIREIAAHLLVERARESLGLASGAPTLHMCFSGNPGTGKTTVALRMAEVLHRLGYIRRNHLVSVTRDDLVGQYIGHTAPKTRDVLKRAMGGVLFIDEAYYLYRPENERDYGQEAIEILLQTMENQRDDLVVILAGYASRMEVFFESNPGFRSRIAHHITFPDYGDAELLDIAERMLATMHYRFDTDSRRAFADYLALRTRQPNFANARSVRNALDRSRLRQANRLFARAIDGGAPIDAAALTLIAAEDIRASRVFAEASAHASNADTPDAPDAPEAHHTAPAPPG
ncbi:putative Rubsico expression protein CbbX [Burkholderia sp. OAS925]|jgi:probable Rubsico expression protein CbbX|uniref:CbbX protein n=1 Tax=Paraburkholderia graminis (strain ATCC 700544 / DSM 17151 / LMG 18924 / NCIMB 13744 / C4D1M) TaxID=396598 RepID=B1FSF3_PARG4|nr:CbbX protein [Paraburkholderia graminis]EDT12668.1 CbbX protein [Paraburkholderia graminis C4D1M]MDR6475672.1 putative Rubsico expression protein CbbX [Paraburkholderia graminis]CAB3654896.1 Protein CbbX [Paraburkholderia graminis C4D1M]